MAILYSSFADVSRGNPKSADALVWKLSSYYFCHTPRTLATGHSTSIAHSDSVVCMPDKTVLLAVIGDSSKLFASDEDLLLGVEGSSGTSRPRGVLGKNADAKSLI
jgi:hypothetical protein